MFKKLFKTFILAVSVLLSTSGSFSALASKVHLGVLAWRDAPSLQQGWQPTLQALEQQLGGHPLQVHWLDLQELEEAIAEQQLDFVLTNPGHYVDLSSRYRLAPLASLQNPGVDPPQQAIGSVVVALAERKELNTWQDLRGQRLAAVSPHAFGGYQLIQDAMEQEGFNWQQELGSLEFSGFPMEQLLDWLDAGRADALVLRSCLLESLAEADILELADYRVVAKQQQTDYPCLHSSHLYPDWPFLRLGSTEPELARQVTLALLSSQLPEGVATGYQWTAPLSYQPVYELFERLRLGPFAAFPKNPVQAFIQQYRYWLLAGLALLLLIFAHHLRAGYLVRRRTQELKAAEMAGRQKQAELIHLSRFALMGELAAGLAHELNQPLTSIVNYARGSRNYLQAETPPTEAQRQRLLDAMNTIASQGEQAAAIIKNLRSFLRKEKTDWQSLDARELMQEALEFMQSHLQREGVRLEQEYEPALPGIQGNRVQLLQILINLLANALDAMQPLHPDERCLQLGCRRLEQALEFWVADSGAGLTPEAEEQLFTPFFTTKDQGMGLGLKLSQSLAEAHRGQLTLENAPHGGVLARLRLPLSDFPGKMSGLVTKD